MDKVKNQKLKRSLFLYLILFLTLGIILTLFTKRIFADIEDKIWIRNLKDVEEYKKWQKEYKKEFNDFLPIPSVALDHLDATDRILKEICDFGETWSLFFFAFGSALVAVIVFYNKKLKKPLELLNNCAKEIERSNLDFKLVYNEKDEMGELCRAFEKMRLQLAENNSYMWKMVEDQKQLRAALTHDIRAPLAVLKGYVQLLLKCIPEKRLSNDKQIEMLKDIEEQALRLENFTNTFKKIQCLDKLEIVKVKISVDKFIEDIKKTIFLLNEQLPVKIIFKVIKSDIEMLNLDYNIVLEVLENIYYNAVRYAESTIIITIQCIDHASLNIITADDGKGFTEKDIVNGCKCFYHDESDESGNHYGMGLYICKILAQKHGGTIDLSNNDSGGGFVSVTFIINQTILFDYLFKSSHMPV